MSDCDTVAVASSTLAGSFFASAGLIVCRALRIVTAASCELTSTRRAPRAWNTCWWAREHEVVDRLLDRRRGHGGGDRVGHHGPRRRHEVRRAGEPERRLVGDVVAHFLALRCLGRDVGEAVGLEHPGGEPPAEGAEHDEQGARRARAGAPSSARIPPRAVMRAAFLQSEVGGSGRGGAHEVAIDVGDDLTGRVDVVVLDTLADDRRVAAQAPPRSCWRRCGRRRARSRRLRRRRARLVHAR